jgi:hypothetical protein
MYRFATGVPALEPPLLLLFFSCKKGEEGRKKEI